MTHVVPTDILTKEILSEKKVFFMLISLQLHLIDYIGKQTFMGKKFTPQFHALLWTFFLIFHFKLYLGK